MGAKSSTFPGVRTPRHANNLVLIKNNWILSELLETKFYQVTHSWSCSRRPTQFYPIFYNVITRTHSSFVFFSVPGDQIEIRWSNRNRYWVQLGKTIILGRLLQHISHNWRAGHLIEFNSTHRRVIVCQWPQRIRQPWSIPQSLWYFDCVQFWTSETRAWVMNLQ